MRKIVALLLALMMSCMLIPVMAEDSITGEWYASFMGVAITLTVNEDGSFQMALPGQDPTVGTWTLEGDQFTMTADVSAGSLTSEVVNNQGSTLPSTGGMGTTIFYVIGGILVLAAVIVLISKRRVQQ